MPGALVVLGLGIRNYAGAILLSGINYDEKKGYECIIGEDRKEEIA